MTDHETEVSEGEKIKVRVQCQYTNTNAAAAETASRKSFTARPNPPVLRAAAPTSSDCFRPLRCLPLLLAHEQPTLPVRAAPAGIRADRERARSAPADESSARSRAHRVVERLHACAAAGSTSATCADTRRRRARRQRRARPYGRRHADVSHQLTQAYLDRIAKIDDAGPTLAAVIETSPTAIADADALDAEHKAGKTRGPLHGIPVVLKDNIDVSGMVNSAGSLALAENRPKQDAFIVAGCARRAPSSSVKPT